MCLSIRHTDLSRWQEKYFIYLIATIAALGGLLFGYDTGIIAGALIFVEKSFALTTFLKELIVSSVVLGALFGAFFSGKLANLFGRRRMLIIASGGFLIGTLGSSLAINPWMLIVSRFIIGIFIGVSSYVAPLFISEMAPREKRGALVLLCGIAITGGEVLAFLVDYLLVPTGSWRDMFATGLIPAIALLIGMLLVPATPRWLALKGHLEHAQSVLQKIRGTKDTKMEFNEIINSLDYPKARWDDLFSKRIRPVLIIGLGLGVLQQFAGINTVMYYGPYIFKAASFTGADTQILATLSMGLVNTLMTVVSIFIVDRLGRRPMLIAGTCIASISLAIVGVLFELHSNSHLYHDSILFFMMTYIAGYSLSLGGLFWLIIAEIYPLRLRATAMSFVSGVQWASNFIVAITFLSILHTIGPADTFWVYGLMCLIAFLFCYFLVPETNHISLEEIETQLLQGKKYRELGASTAYR